MTDESARDRRPGETDNEWFARMLKLRREDDARKLEEAKRVQTADGKEPFDLAKLEAVYDTTNFMGELDPDEAARAAHWEFEYYVRKPNVRTIEEFARVQAELDLWSN